MRHSLFGKDGLSAIDVWGQAPTSNFSNMHAFPDISKKRPRDAGEDDKEALVAHIEALFADLK